MCCPWRRLDDKKSLFVLSVSEVRESTIGSENIVTNPTPDKRNTQDFKRTFHLAISRLSYIILTIQSLNA